MHSNHLLQLMMIWIVAFIQLFLQKSVKLTKIHRRIQFYPYGGADSSSEAGNKLLIRCLIAMKPLATNI